MGTIRLACLLCDTDDSDFIDSIPATWRDVDEIQSYEDATEGVTTQGQGNSAWWTHVGICPKCQEVRFQPAEATTA